MLRICFLVALLGVVASWDTSYDNEFTYQCPANQHLYRIRSEHSNRREDRVWDFYCRNNDAVSNTGCSWTGYLNNMDKEVNYICPSGKVLVGINSYHNNGAEDRRWKAKCCNGKTEFDGCSWSGYWNNWDGKMDSSISSNQVIRGMYSQHDNGREDRLFKYYICKKKKINGNWAGYGPYGSCSKNCGGGTQSRSRTCTNPAPLNGGSYCAGSATSSRACNTQACPVNGNWAAYGAYGQCSKNCGGGTQTRSRTCSNPAPAHGGQTCAGSATDSRACNTQACPIDGNWGKWSPYTECTKECGGGTMERTRACSNPAPQHGGKECVGDATETSACNEQVCLMKECNVDVALVLDASYSQSHAEEGQAVPENAGWKKQVDFAVNFAKKAPQGMHVSVMVYSEKAVIKHKFTRNHEQLGIFLATLAAPGYISRMDLALKAIENEAFTTENGARSDSFKKVVLVSDGDQTTRRLVPSEVDPVPIAKKLRDSGIEVDCMAVKDYQGAVDHAELEAVAGGKDEVFELADGGADKLEEHLTKTCTANYRMVPRV